MVKISKGLWVDGVPFVDTAEEDGVVYLRMEGLSTENTDVYLTKSEALVLINSLTLVAESLDE